MSWEIIGHAWAVEMLKSHLVQGELRHAYLFTGPQGVGRRTLAICLAQAINCTAPPSPGEACQICSNCTRIRRQQHPDLDIIEAEREGGVIKVEQIRELQYHLSLTPYEASYRVALLKRFEEANNYTANALLKTLEEPPSKVVLMLTAESSVQLLPTITSRCEVIRLRPVQPEILIEGLEQKLGITTEEARELALQSGGCPGYAMSLHQQPERRKKRQTWLDDHGTLLSENFVKRFEFVNVISKDRENLRDFLHIMLSFWRDVALCATGVQSHLYNPDRIGEIEKLAQASGIDTARRVVANIEHTLWMLDHNINPRLAIEILLMDMPRV